MRGAKFGKSAAYLCPVNSGREEPKPVPLSRLRAGSSAIIQAHDESSDFRITLMEMGCVPGEPVSVEMVAPMGDPLAIRIAGYYLSIRKQDAEKIWVLPVAKK